MRTRVLLDCDGVLADFADGAHDVIKQVTGTRTEQADSDWELFGHLTDAEREEVFQHIQGSGWCQSLKVYPGAQEAVRELMGHADVFIVTTAFWNAPTWCHDRTRWLQNHFGISYQNVLFASVKYLVQGDIFVDDKPSNVRDWREHFPAGHGFVWSGWLEEGNRDMEPYATKDWGEVLKLV